jgi:hypothetical protein
VIADWNVTGVYPFRKLYLLPAAYLALAGGMRWLYHRSGAMPLATGLANVLAVGAALPPIVTLALGYGGCAEPVPGAPPSLALAAQHRSKPDIYYLVFDRYGDEETISQQGLDNRGFYEYLESRGFYVARESRSNYLKTALSLASSLNFEFLDEADHAHEGTGSFGPVYAALANHMVGVFLQSQGYSYTHLGSWYWPTRTNPLATRNLNYYSAVPRAVVSLFDSVLIAPLQEGLEAAWLDERRQEWDRVRRQVDDVVRLIPEKGPKFVMLHVLVPHPPYVFDSDGRFVPRDVERRRSQEENYRNQVMAANAMIRRLVDEIIAHSPSPPAIILQGDEGPYPPGTGRYDYDWRGASTDQLRVKSGILNAYYLPGSRTPPLYPQISPVNTFRVVLNGYFGARLPLLPDRVYRHVSDLRPYAFEDVTDRLRQHAAAR